MDAKSVIISVLIMSLVMAQIQVEASKVCCSSKSARNTYNLCRFKGSTNFCAKLVGCKIVDKTCPGGYNQDILENS